MDALQPLYLKVYAIWPSMNSLVSKISINTENLALKKNSGEHQSQSTVICRSTSYNFVMQLLQSFRCIYVPSMMIIAAIVYEIQ